ncbi:MAG: hypothetical protein QN144_14225 [Armatimonadota bacterium]|nr:hypothetical protein [Armatimonadota bacterium]
MELAALLVAKAGLADGRKEVVAVVPGEPENLGWDARRDRAGLRAAPRAARMGLSERPGTMFRGVEP